MTNSGQQYKYFIGIDMGKNSFDLAVVGKKAVTSYANTPKGFLSCFKDHQHILQGALISVEATGGYEKAFLLFFVSRGIRVHQANPRNVKYFIQSYGTEAKTDALDAKGLALYSFERRDTLALYHIPDPDLETLAKWVKRRGELVAMQTKEKNRLQGPDRELLKESVQSILCVLKQAIEDIEARIKHLIEQNKTLKKKLCTLRKVSGVGDKVALTLLAGLPELGCLTRRQVASLAGVAPHPRQSGQMTGYRRTRGGRTQIKPTLFLAAMAASRSKSDLGHFYRKLLKNGKKPIKALVALMRKIVVIANAKLRDLQRQPLLTT